jgi:hypothetical protein
VDEIRRDSMDCEVPTRDLSRAHSICLIIKVDRPFMRTFCPGIRRVRSGRASGPVGRRHQAVARSAYPRMARRGAS